MAPAVLVVLGCWLAVSTAAAQGIAPGTAFRVFLRVGDALPSYGEAAVVGDRIVFTLVVGASDGVRELQLMSLPVETVDLERTQRYAETIRAEHYAATRGETDYVAMTEEVARALKQLTDIQDPTQRLALAEEAKRRLLAWSRDNYSYRADDIRELAALFDEVINQLRAAAGQSQFTLDLDSGPTAAEREPILPAPTLRESIQLALRASAVADVADERVAILRVAAARLADAPTADDADLRTEVARELELEQAAGQAYARLFSEVRARANAAMARGETMGIDAAVEQLRSRDEQLGRRRTQDVSALLAELDRKLADTTIHRKALDHYAEVRQSLLDYERAARAPMVTFDGLTPVFLAIREVRYTAYERLERANARMKTALASFSRLAPPPDLVDVHATLQSAFRLAEYACARRRLAAATVNESIAKEASAAVAGAMLLFEQAHTQLVARLYPPKIQ